MQCWCSPTNLTQTNAYIQVLAFRAENTGKLLLSQCTWCQLSWISWCTFSWINQCTVHLLWALFHEIALEMIPFYQLNTIYPLLIPSRFTYCNQFNFWCTVYYLHLYLHWWTCYHCYLEERWGCDNTEHYPPANQETSWSCYGYLPDIAHHWSESHFGDIQLHSGKCQRRIFKNSGCTRWDVNLGVWLNKSQSFLNEKHRTHGFLSLNA